MTQDTRLRFYDSFSGLIPCKVTLELGYGFTMVKFTATRGAYKRGDVDSVSTKRLVRREQVHVRNGQYYIRTAA